MRSLLLDSTHPQEYRAKFTTFSAALLIPIQNECPKFAQIYFISNEESEVTTRSAIVDGLKSDTIRADSGAFKPEPIMHLIYLLFFLEFPIISPIYLFPCHHLLFLYYSSNFIASVTVMSTLHMIAEKWVHFTARAITIIFS